jgi:hypothetical protein
MYSQEPKGEPTNMDKIEICDDAPEEHKEIARLVKLQVEKLLDAIIEDVNMTVLFNAISVMCATIVRSKPENVEMTKSEAAYILMSTIHENMKRVADEEKAKSAVCH